MDQPQPFARGRTAELYELPDGRALKLYGSGLGPKAVEREIRAMKLAHAGGLRVPWPAERCDRDGRAGIAMPMLRGQNGMERLLADLDRIDEDAAELAALHGTIHSCSGRGLPERRQVLADRIAVAPGLSGSETIALIKMALALPEGGSMLHGDFHPGNLVWASGDPWIIDWIDACRGVPEADVARSLILFGHGLPDGESAPNRDRYRSVYAEAMGPGRQLELWLLATGAARLAEEASSSQPYLLAWVKQEALRLLA